MRRKANQAPTVDLLLPSLGEGVSGTGNPTSEKKEVIIMFDISKLAVAATSIIDLEDPNGDLLVNDKGDTISVTVYGPGSKQFQKASGIRNRAILDYVRKGGKKLKDDEQRELDADFLASCTVSFNGFTYKEFTGYEMFKNAYLDPSIGFVSEQVNKAIGDWSNFTQASPKI
jgi:hypothetical protein